MKSVDNIKKWTYEEIIEYAVEHGKESAANIMLLAGAEGTDMTFVEYCELYQRLTRED